MREEEESMHKIAKKLLALFKADVKAKTFLSIKYFSIQSEMCLDKQFNAFSFIYTSNVCVSTAVIK
jgi:hypothetical protein